MDYEERLTDWMRECLVFDVSVRIASAEIYANYKEWCVRNQCYAESHRRVSQHLMRHGIQARKSGNRRDLIGIMCRK